MFQIEVHRNIRQIIEFLYRIHIWHRQDEKSIGEWKWNLFYTIYYCLYPISFIAGALTNENMNEKVVAVAGALIAMVLLMKLWYIIRRKDEILELIDRICVYAVDDLETYNLANYEFDNLMKFAGIFLKMIIVPVLYISLVAPFLGSERQIFAPVGFPLDWRNSDFAFGMVCLFIATQSAITVTLVAFSAIVWYLMLNCKWRYYAVGQQMKKMGELRGAVTDVSTSDRKMSKIEKDNLYLRDLAAALVSYNSSKE